MKISHLAIIFVIIMLPFSIICRNTIRERIYVLEDRVRINNVLDIATQDALSTLIDLNDEFQMLYLNERFDVTPILAQEAVDSFFRTMSVNFNLPYIKENIEGYFGQYIPAIVVIAYDGFYIYSIDDSDSGKMYQMSPKIPYTYYDEDSDSIVSFTLGNYIRLLTNAKGTSDRDTRYYEGELSKDYFEDSSGEYQMYFDAYNDGVMGVADIEKMVYENITDLTSDLSLILYADAKVNDSSGIPSFLIVNSGEVPLKQDYSNTEQRDASAFHTKRREVVLSIIKDTLRQEINEHNGYAHLMGSVYNFTLPEVADDEWANSINDISVMAFIQGMKAGINSYYDDYALGGSRIVETSYLYGTGTPPADGAAVTAGDAVYHKSWCSEIAADQSNVTNIFINRVQAAQAKYWPCMKCNP